MNKFRFSAIFLGVITLTVDQFLKWQLRDIAVANTGSLLGIEIIPDTLQIIIMLVVLIVGLASLIYMQHQIGDTLWSCLMFLLIAGTSNVIDKLRLGYIVDYIDMRFFVVNLADISINLMLLLVGIIYLSKYVKDGSNSNRER